MRNLIIGSIAELDRPYIESWAARLGTRDIWQEILCALPTPSSPS